RANPKKTKAIEDMQSPKTLKEMGSRAKRAAERALPFFETLKNITKENKEDYRWTEEAEHAFQELKKLILELPTPTTPEQKETLFVYLATSYDAVSGVLVADRKGKQTPIRNKTYGSMQSGWGRRPTRMNLVYGASSLKGVGASLVLIFGMEYTYAIRLTFPSTNNEAEYEALLVGLRLAWKMKVHTLDVKVDSKLVACQMNEYFVTSNEGMEKYLAKAKKQASLFKKFSIKNIPRNQNQKADVLSKLASVTFNHLTKEILIEVLNAKYVDVQEVSTIMEEEEDNWMTPIIKYLEEGTSLTDENEARTLRMKIGQYVMEDGVLFKNSYRSPMLRCVGLLQANYIVREVHEEACGMHASARSVVAKIMSRGSQAAKDTTHIHYVSMAVLPMGP
ncbi:reverse transcriptase domain-containing protein, partial [Tanacetum coccineum]